MLYLDVQKIFCLQYKNLITMNRLTFFFLFGTKMFKLPVIQSFLCYFLLYKYLKLFLLNCIILYKCIHIEYFISIIFIVLHC
jgi:hypothetical protein